MPPVQMPFYIHYKIFDMDKDTYCETLHPVYSTDPFIGRIDANLIPPPHTVSALVERICKREKRGFGLDWDNDDAFETVLFKNASSLASYDLNSDPFPLTDNCPGSSPVEPLILKVGYKEIQELFGLW
ncbi:hypothetical protein M413DRAFT_27301 [Hebeloma cylindrosporum]|uniref:Uncharacterized protein n=1 Tax=Hebeloma cylindrosporum TaxID=76867 RepID=A0A0C3CBU9_HEBCY|nr:hypothetical protein M413DRAFT_27301 [Hebeloma cylindrosporum h7]